MLNRYVPAILLSSASFWLASADTLQLKDKAAITGKILARKHDQVAIDVGYTVLVVPRSQIPALLEARSRISDQYRIPMPTYGHAGDGNLHVNFLWSDPDDEPRVGQAVEALFREVVRLRGTLTGEHGIGVLKAPYLHLEQSPELIAFQQRIKATFDPRGILNPGKIFIGDVPHRAC